MSWRPRPFRTQNGWHLYWGPLEVDVYVPSCGGCWLLVELGPLSLEAGRWYVHAAVDL